MPEELWMEIHDIVRKAEIKTIPKKKKCKKAKWLSEEALQIAEKRRSERQRRKGKIYPFEYRVPKYSKVPGAGERHSTRDKGHEEGGSAYAKAGSSLRSPPGYSRASTPKKPESAYFIALCSHL